MVDGTSNSTVVLIIGLLGAIIAQIFTLITLKFNARQAREKEEQRRAWEIEDRKVSLAATSKLTEHVQASGERLAAAIADNTQKTITAATPPSRKPTPSTRRSRRSGRKASTAADSSGLLR
jgi:hypothetical protein